MTTDVRRRRVLRLLESVEEALTVAEIADRLDERPTTVRFHLDALAADGQVEKAPGAATGRGRPALVYRAARSLRGDGSTDYRLLATILVDALAGSGEALGTTEALAAAGSRWVPELVESTGAQDVAGLVDALGFRPDPVGPDGDLVLRHCPFFDLAVARREVVCPVHLGILQGATAELAPGASVVSLVPFARPDACVAHLSGDLTGVA
jgi:predicted ArsR family transcriptional regulator